MMKNCVAFLTTALILIMIYITRAFAVQSGSENTVWLLNYIIVPVGLLGFLIAYSTIVGPSKLAKTIYDLQFAKPDIMYVYQMEKGLTYVVGSIDQRKKIVELVKMNKERMGVYDLLKKHPDLRTGDIVYCDDELIYRINSLREKIIAPLN